MKDAPIIFSGPMVRAILEGRKTQTRRIIKLPPAPMHLGQWEPSEIGGDGSVYADGTPTRKTVCIWHTRTGKCIATPQQPGQLLWVKETWRPNDIWPEITLYKADHPETLGWRSSRYMPRKASRITLEVEAVRVERLQDISAADAIAEGIQPSANSLTIDCNTPDPRHEFRALWDDINGMKSWPVNPWVTAITFRPILKNIDIVIQEKIAA